MESDYNEIIQKFPTKLKKLLSSEKQLHRFKCGIGLRISYNPITVFRAIHGTDCVSQEDFLDSMDTAIFFNTGENPSGSLETFAISVNESLEAIQLQLNIPNKKKKLLSVAKGIMQMEYGPATFDEDRPHHNWFLFDNVPESLKKEFEVI